MKRKPPDVGVVIAGGGRGSRLGGKLPKQYLLLAGKPILAHTLRVFDGMAEIGAIVVVVPAGHLARTRALITRAGISKVVAIVPGGKERQSSVRAGLESFPRRPAIVLVHDAVRPFVRRRVVRNVILAARRYNAAVVGVSVTDTIKEADDAGFYARTLARDRLRAVQTPQGFKFDLLLWAHREASRRRFVGTDEASLVERLGIHVRIVKGDSDNLKITTREDLKIAKFRMK